MRLKRGRGPYFARIPHDLQDEPDITPEAIAVYAALQRFADFGGETGARVKDRVAASKAGVSVRTFIDRRKWLAERGWLAWESGAATAQPNTYLVHQSKGGESAPAAHSPATEAATDEAALQSAPAAHPSVQEPHTLPAAPADPVGTARTPLSNDREPATESQGPKGGKDTWLTPYLTTYRQHVGEPSSEGQLVHAVDPAHKDLGAEASLALFTRWCVSDSSRFGLAWYRANWKKAVKPTAPRPTADLGHKDYAEGLEHFSGPGRTDPAVR